MHKSHEVTASPLRPEAMLNFAQFSELGPSGNGTRGSVNVNTAYKFHCQSSE